MLLWVFVEEGKVGLICMALVLSYVVGCKSSCLPERQERVFVVQTRRFPMHGLGMMSRRSKIPLKCWCLLSALTAGQGAECCVN